MMEKPVVSGIALDRYQSRVSIVGLEDKPGMVANIFGSMSKHNINVDMIVQTVAHDGKTNLDFTVPQVELPAVKEALHGHARDIYNVEYDDNISVVSLVGVGMKSNSGVASKAFETFAQENINIAMISTSEIRISIVLDAKYGELAVRALHAAYELDK